jgi:cephalosporin hydroxylase
LCPAAAETVPLPDPELCKRVTKEFMAAGGLLTVGFAGIRSVQSPMDNWMMQQIMSELRPDFVIETGTLHGGTTLYYATVLGQVKPQARVLTVDIKKQWDEAATFPAWKERVEFFEGSSTAPEVVEQIAKRVKAVKNATVLVTLDSLHTKEHVARELELYAPLVTKGSYLVVQDTWYDTFGMGNKNGPLVAVQEFLKSHPEFETDRERERYLVTFYPFGYLKRVR